MVTIVETASFLAQSKGFLDAEGREALFDRLARNPEAGVRLVAGAGLRKLRVPRPGTGKSGGARVITYFSDLSKPLFLLAYFTKSQKANLSKADLNALAQLANTLNERYGGSG